MSELITIVQHPSRHALAVAEKVGTMKLGKVMGPAYQEITDLLKKQNIECGAQDVPFTLYKNVNWDTMNKKGFFAMVTMLFFHQWDMEIGIPCPEQATGEGRIHSITLDEGKYIRAIHTGPYMKVGDTYTCMQHYAAEQQMRLKPLSIEFYLNDPRKVKPEELETEVLVPVG